MKPILDDDHLISELDKSGMLNAVLDAGKQMLDAKKAGASVEIKKNFNGIIFSGMGGSAISGDIVSSIFFDTLKTPIYVNRDYILPCYFDEKNLFIAVSYSGNTEETLYALKEAENRGMPIVCVGSGGKLKEAASSKKYPFIEVPSGFPPRAAFYSIFTSLINLLETLRLIPSQKEKIMDAMQVIEDMKNEIGRHRPERGNEAKQLAQKIKDKIPLIFACSFLTEKCGLRLKTQFNENSKLPALLSVFPELNHNELVGFSLLKKGEHPFATILLRDEEEHIRINKRIEITKSLIGANLGGVFEIKSRGKSRLSRLLSLIFYGDLLSVYTALLRKVDPTPVSIIEKLKKELKR